MKKSMPKETTKASISISSPDGFATVPLDSNTERVLRDLGLGVDKSGPAIKKAKDALGHGSNTRPGRCKHCGKKIAFSSRSVLGHGTLDAHSTCALRAAGYDPRTGNKLKDADS